MASPQAGERLPDGVGLPDVSPGQRAGQVAAVAEIGRAPGGEITELVEESRRRADTGKRQSQLARQSGQVRRFQMASQPPLILPQAMRDWRLSAGFARGRGVCGGICRRIGHGGGRSKVAPRGAECRAFFPFEFIESAPEKGYLSLFA